MLPKRKCRKTLFASRPLAGHIRILLVTVALYGAHSSQLFAQTSPWVLGSGGAIYYNSGNVGIGVSSGVSKLDVRGTRYGVGLGAFQGVAGLFSTDPFGAGVGGGLMLGGSYNGSEVTAFGQLAGVKENSTDGNYAGALAFSTRGNSDFVNEWMRIDSQGRVGIGTKTPVGGLQVANGYLYQTANVNGGGVSSSFINGGLAIGWNRIAGTGETDFITNRGGGPGGFQFTDFNNSVYTNLMTIQSAGNVGIGTTAPQYKLAVNGTIGAKEVIVTNTGWADYVFQPGYRLKPLTEVGAYIREHRHLPEMPSEREVIEKGAGLGEMQVKMLAKIEELTLHLIEAEEKNRRLERQSLKIEKQSREIEKRMAVIERRLAGDPPAGDRSSESR